jgi:hypothetical protein
LRVIEENSKNGAQKSIGPFGTLAVIVIILLIWFVGGFAYQINRQTSKGKAWCESVISEYEADREKFLEVRSDKLHHGRLLLFPSPEYKGVKGKFIVENNGEYICRYYYAGSGHGYEYSSKTREWIYAD